MRAIIVNVDLMPPNPCLVLKDLQPLLSYPALAYRRCDTVWCFSCMHSLLPGKYVVLTARKHCNYRVSEKVLYYTLLYSFPGYSWLSPRVELEQQQKRQQQPLEMKASLRPLCWYRHRRRLRGKSLLESQGTTFLPDWQSPLIFVWFISNFLCMCSNSMASAHVILK